MENAYEEHVCLCALQNQFGFEPKIPLALIDRLGSAAAVFSLDHDSLREIFGPYGKQDLITKQALDDADRILSTLSPDCRFIGFGESGYPALLADCPDPPAGLYYRSTSPPEMVFRDLEAIAVVGTRNCSSYGYDMCDKVVRALAGSSRSPLIVSGLALGIDGIAHRAALEAGGTTVGVMATGIESVYPSRHEELAQRIVQTPGCALVTDYPPGTQPLAIHFLRRNRIIAGLSRATILAESRIRGGGMMTARLAASYDREVFAI
ncbi:MAG: DNA-protecting protein DprA, partial [Bacteroidales bacterium]|nr:DNA-protecting protein DprA [Bacteroidales bacterium]